MHSGYRRSAGPSGAGAIEAEIPQGFSSISPKKSQAIEAESAGAAAKQAEQKRLINCGPVRMASFINGGITQNQRVFFTESLQDFAMVTSALQNLRSHNAHWRRRIRNAEMENVVHPTREEFELMNNEKRWEYVSYLKK